MFKKHTLSIVFFCSVSVTALLAGNPNRAGQAGANELLINPWARSSGWGGVNTASVRGLEALYGNVAGTAFTKKTELIFARTAWLKGTEININAFGFTQRVGETGVLGFGIMSMDFGEIKVTSVDQPDGGMGTYSPQFTNMSLSYAKEFSHSIYGGAVIKLISEAIPDISAEGVAFDAGIQYVTGKKDQIKFGIALKNVGPTMHYSGAGLGDKTSKTTAGTTYELSINHRSEIFELPSLFNIGGSYDYLIGEMHRVTGAANFISNSFTKDEFQFGLEYGFRNYAMVRAGYTYSEKDELLDLHTSAYTGLSAGFTVELPLGKSGKSFALDYSYRDTDHFDGTHSIGARLNF
jgi:hypothetical protein